MPDLDLDPILLLPLALVLILMSLPILSRKIWGPVEHILPFHVNQKLAASEPLAVFDLRNEKARARGAIAGAKAVSIDELDRAVAGRESPDVPIVLVCESDMSATRQAARLTKAGHPNVLVMKGGMLAWKRAKLPVAT